MFAIRRQQSKTALLGQNSLAQKCERQCGDSAEINDADFRDGAGEVTGRQQMDARQIAAPCVFQSFGRRQVTAQLGILPDGGHQYFTDLFAAFHQITGL